MKLLTTLFFLCLGLWAPPVLAAPSLGISPLMLHITPRDKAATLTLTNGGDQPITLTVRVLRWTQAQGEDVLQPTTDVVAAPASVTLRPGAHQVVRLANLALPSGAETAYRVLVTQVPSSDAPGVRTLLQLSVPLFEGLLQGAPRLTVTRDGDRLVLTNSGDVHARLTRVDYRDDAGWHTLAGLTYLLPGQSRAFTAPGSLDLRYSSDDSPQPVILPAR
ncbi:fimbrial chaperone protein [Deinococcus metalli]|uniref:Fimbrial chaperone protein n=1 Tax=Deinococcus metalli TaxID=1141878 RepID=A0A7W8KDE8_9DEIO|nr:fimbria/pilus periplasmic chaperone [Deinococcus metalli]MBB5376142.1 fimbrial chaperone protein [Deinococcus metalli]GHF40481.1 pilus assembly protein [Deinococcus metalli]